MQGANDDGATWAHHTTLELDNDALTAGPRAARIPHGPITAEQSELERYLAGLYGPKAK